MVRSRHYSFYGLDRLCDFTVTVFGPGLFPFPVWPGDDGLDRLCGFTPTVFLLAIVLLPREFLNRD